MVEGKRIGYWLIGSAVFLLYFLLYGAFLQIFVQDAKTIRINALMQVIFFSSLFLIWIGLKCIIEHSEKGYNEALHKLNYRLRKFLFDILLIAPMALISFVFVKRIEPKWYVYLGVGIVFVIYFAVKEYAKRFE